MQQGMLEVGPYSPPTSFHGALLAHFRQPEPWLTSASFPKVENVWRTLVGAPAPLHSTPHPPLQTLCSSHQPFSLVSGQKDLLPLKKEEVNIHNKNPNDPCALELPLLPARICSLLLFTANGLPTARSDGFACPRLAAAPSKVTHYLPIAKPKD